MIEIGTILQNRYRIEKQIGQGGMGKVYVATDERFKSTVAIKETVFEDSNLRKAFEREARLLNSLKHSALPRVSDHFNEAEGQFLVMEYIAGEDLAEMMERNGEAFPLETVLNWANQLCDALEFLHSQDIIHRDIKPQNLKLTPNGHIVLLDFGLAKGNPSDAQHQTAAKSIFGYSRSYASLEQIQGTGTEPRSDLYSLGATLYHLLTGIPPADALTRAMNVLNGQPDPLIPAHLVNNLVPHEVTEILQKSMALNANERPISAMSLKLMLKKCNKEINENETKGMAQLPFTADLLTQNTKLFSSTTNVNKINQSQIETKISPENQTNEKSYKTNVITDNPESKITNIQPAIVNTINPKNRKVVVASILGSLLLVGSAFSAMYLYSPSVSENNSNVETINNEMKTGFVKLPENENISNTNVSNENIESEVAKETEPHHKQSKLKVPETSQAHVRHAKKQQGKSQIATKTRKGGDESNEVVIRGETIETDGMIIDENGIRMKKQPPLPPGIPKHPKAITLEQLRRLERIRNAKKRIIVVETPETENKP